jgi:hypothetical protein
MTKATLRDIYRKNAAPQSEHADEALAFTATVSIPQCGYPVCGKEKYEKYCAQRVQNFQE